MEPWSVYPDLTRTFALSVIFLSLSLIHTHTFSLSLSLSLRLIHMSLNWQVLHHQKIVCFLDVPNVSLCVLRMKEDLYVLYVSASCLQSCIHLFLGSMGFITTANITVVTCFVAADILQINIFGQRYIQRYMELLKLFQLS